MEHKKRCFPEKYFIIKNKGIILRKLLHIHRPYFLPESKKSILLKSFVENRDYKNVNILGIQGKLINANSILQTMKNYLARNEGQKKTIMWWFCMAIKNKITKRF